MSTFKTHFWLNYSLVFWFTLRTRAIQKPSRPCVRHSAALGWSRLPPALPSTLSSSRHCQSEGKNGWKHRQEKHLRGGGRDGVFCYLWARGTFSPFLMLLTTMAADLRDIQTGRKPLLEGHIYLTDRQTDRQTRKLSFTQKQLQMEVHLSLAACFWQIKQSLKSRSVRCV